MKSLWIVTNIPTPYRIYFFQHLHRELKERNVNFHVSFMARTERGRNWRYETGADLCFPYTIHKGIHPRIWNVAFHFNPGIALRAASGQDDICIVAGGWLMPSALIVPVSRGRGPTLFWSESNMDSLRRTRRITSAARRMILSRFDGFCVPNDRATQWLAAHVSGLKHKKLISLPNLVDEGIYAEGTRQRRKNMAGLRKKYHIRGEDRVLVCPARLMPRKGIGAFLQAFGVMPAAGITLLVAGDGPERDHLAHLAAANSFFSVKFLGFCSLETMLDLYAISNGFLLPSFEDPNPLSVIEACHSGLPLLLSRRLGNCPEALIDGKNGWAFDPGDAASIRSAVDAFVQAPASQLEQMGQMSASIGQHHFSTTATVVRLIRSLETLIQ